jgi:hypothetical protein
MSYQTQQALELMVKNIDEKVKQIEETLGARTAKSYEEYCEQCGVITGLLTARRFAADLTRNLEKLDE